MLAMKELGRKAYDMHSSNYFYRYQVDDLIQIAGKDDVYPGMLLFKTRSDSESGYDLSDTYITGRYNTGDYLDAYHVGVVTGVTPLEITECTSTGEACGIKITSTLGSPSRGGWDCGGKLKGINYDDYTEEDETMLYENGVKATVNTGKAGTKTWNLRSAPDATDENVIYETADGWGQVEYNGTRGYMKEEAYAVSSGAGDSSDDTASDDDSSGVTVTLTAAEVAAIKSIGAKL